MDPKENIYAESEEIENGETDSRDFEDWMDREAENQLFEQER